jgi:glycosyltransferase involved in cell wall biosynthesis
MQTLAGAQLASGEYAAVGLGVVADSRWPAAYERQLKAFAGLKLRGHAPKLPGTLASLWQIAASGCRLIGHWAEKFAEEESAARVVVHLHNAWMSGQFLPLQPPVGCELVTVATFHGVNVRLRGMALKRRIHHWLTRRLVRSACRLTSVDGGNIPLAEELLGVPASRFTVVPNGLPDNGEQGCPFVTGREQVLTIGHVGTISEEKGWQLLAETVEELAEAGRTVRALIAGVGPEAEQATAMAAASFNGCVQYLGHVDDPRLTLFPKLDLLTVMSRHEGLPMSIIEAMCAGVPSIATPVGGVPELIEDGENGCLVPRRRESLVAAIDGLLTDASTLFCMSKAARTTFLERFEINQIVAQYNDLYLGPAKPRKTGLKNRDSR